MRVDVAAAGDAEQTASCLDCESASIYNEERSGIEIAEAALGVPRRVGQLPFYSGNKILSMAEYQWRLTRYVGEHLGLHVGSSVPRHFLIPSDTETFLEEEDREYLKAKGVFTLPQNDTCAALLRVYLSHVHPVYPVIEVEQLWDCYHNGRLGQYNLLLLWSIFSVAVNVKRLSRTHPSLTDQKSVVYLVSGFRTRGVQVSTAYEGRHVLSSKGTQPPRPVIHFCLYLSFSVDITSNPIACGHQLVHVQQWWR